MSRSLEDRKFVVITIFGVVALAFAARLFYLQVVDDSLKSSAENQSIRYVTQYPVRGNVYDRNGALLVYNEAAYDLMVVPRQVKAMDTLAFCELVGITLEDFRVKFTKAKDYAWRKASAFEKQIPANSWAPISEKLHNYPGFYGQQRTLRRYPDPIAAHVLGYISEVNQRDIERDPNRYYESGDYIGKSGLERTYEAELRGIRGVKALMVDVHNIVQGSYQDGARDTLAISGKDLMSTLDAQLQAYGELLMHNKKGSIVAIEPSTGEVLSMVSSPNFDPNLLVGRDRGKHYKTLAANDSLDPLYNRATYAIYPPGSIFKLVQALIAMEDDIITPNTGFACNKALVGCHNHPHPSSVGKAVQFSCNPYFYNVFKRLINRNEASSTFKDSEIGLRRWKKQVESFGLGVKLPLDIPGKWGNIPGPGLYDKFYGKGSWAFSTIYSLSIGQGEIIVNPVQMANLAAILANRGHYYPPHLVKQIGEDGTKRTAFTSRQTTVVGSEHFETVINGMQAVVDAPGGTARRARIKGIDVCGKTGTAENPHGEDHSVFIAFAPRENPQIAIAVYVENAGFGGTWAAPIASLMIEQYLTDSIADPAKEARILEANLLDVQVEEEGDAH
ncbi:MAG: penicillin-binding protein 2 [Salibacteraceae bacterium]